MSRITALVVACSAVLGALVSAAQGQVVREVPPFFGGNTAIFDPEISVVESGAKLDVQATVSADRKYVTMTMRPQLATLVAIREFTFQNGGPRGVVGIPPVPNPVIQNANPDRNMDRNANPQPGARAAKKADKARPEKAAAAPAPPATAPAAPRAAAPSVLEREGMFRLVFQSNP